MSISPPPFLPPYFFLIYSLPLSPLSLSHPLFATHHVNLALVHQDTDTQEEGEEQFVLLKQRAAHIAVQTESEVVVDGLNTFLQVI